MKRKINSHERVVVHIAEEVLRDYESWKKLTTIVRIGTRFFYPRSKQIAGYTVELVDDEYLNCEDEDFVRFYLTWRVSNPDRVAPKENDEYYEVFDVAYDFEDTFDASKINLPNEMTMATVTADYSKTITAVNVPDVIISAMLPVSRDNLKAKTNE